MVHGHDLFIGTVDKGGDHIPVGTGSRSYIGLYLNQAAVGLTHRDGHRCLPVVIGPVAHTDIQLIPVLRHVRITFVKRDRGIAVLNGKSPHTVPVFIILDNADALHIALFLRIVLTEKHIIIFCAAPAATEFRQLHFQEFVPDHVVGAVKVFHHNDVTEIFHAA